jgi:hypothetical protein
VNDDKVKMSVVLGSLLSCTSETMKSNSQS